MKSVIVTKPKHNVGVKTQPSLVITRTLLGRPNGSSRRSYVLLRMIFISLFILSRDLRAALADRRET